MTKTKKLTKFPIGAGSSILFVYSFVTFIYHIPPSDFLGEVFLCIVQLPQKSLCSVKWLLRYTKKRLDKPKKPCNGGDALKSSFSCIFSAALFFFIFFRLISPYVSMAYSENMKKVEKTVANQSKVSYIF